MNKVVRNGPNYSYEGIRVGVSEVAIIEHPDFLESQGIVKEIRLLMTGYIIKPSIDRMSAWSLGELCHMLVVLYDHSVRNERMKKLTLNTNEFYNEAVAVLGIKRSFEAYKRK